MVCSTVILSSSLALSLLRHSTPSNQSFVLSPFSLNSALSIVHDGANGITQKELTNFLLPGCSPSDVTNLYSSLALSLPSSNTTGVMFKSANRFYIDASISLKSDYQKHVEDKYEAEVKNIKFCKPVEAANEMNKFVEDTTNGKIKQIIDKIDKRDIAYLINAVYLYGAWKYPYEGHVKPYLKNFEGISGNRKIEFMVRKDSNFRTYDDDRWGTVLIVPYQDPNYSFFYIMPAKSSNLEKFRSELNGENLFHALVVAMKTEVDIEVPKIKVESEISNGVELLKELGVKSLFKTSADLSKISSTPLFVSKISQKAVVETNEQGTEAAAATVAAFTKTSGHIGPARPTIIINRPFLFGIMTKNEDILFMGQFV